MLQLVSTSCRRKAATICPTPEGLQVVTQYASYMHMDRSLTRCPCWPANTANQSGLVTLTFDLLTLKVVSESRVTWAISVPILIFLGLSVLNLGPMYATERRQTASSLVKICRGGVSHAGGNTRQITTLLSRHVRYAETSYVIRSLSFYYPVPLYNAHVTLVGLIVLARSHPLLELVVSHQQ